MKASYSRSVTAGISVALQQHRLHPPSPCRAALSRAGHTVTGADEVNDGRAGGLVTAEGCKSGLCGMTSDLAEWE